MPWTKLSDDHFDRLEVIDLSRDARLLDIECAVWSNRALSDGRIPAAALRRITDSPDVDAATNELVKAGLWEATDDGWQVLDWTRTQESADDVRHRQEANRERQAKYRARREAHLAGDHAGCDPRFCATRRNASRNTVTHAVSNDTPTPPDPSRPLPQEGTEMGRVAPLPPPLSLRPGAASTPRPRDKPFSVTITDSPNP
jgi:hypothetical protein